MSSLVDDSDIRRYKGTNVLPITPVIEPFHFALHVFSASLLIMGVENTCNLTARRVERHGRNEIYI